MGDGVFEQDPLQLFYEGKGFQLFEETARATI